jgi:hypothetical protein
VKGGAGLENGQVLRKTIPEHPAQGFSRDDFLVQYFQAIQKRSKSSLSLPWFLAVKELLNPLLNG